MTTPIRPLKSLRFRLPLLSAIMLIATIGALSTAAYLAVRQTTWMAAGARLEGAARQLGLLLKTSADTLTAVSIRVARSPVVRNFLANPARRPGSRLPPSLVAVMEGVRQSDRLIATQIRDRTGRIVAQTGALAEQASPLTAPALEHLFAGKGGATVGAFRAIGDSVIFPVAAPVTEGGRVIGFVVHWRLQVSNPRSRDQIATLFGGPGASLLLSDTTQEIWTDLVGSVPRPPVPINLTEPLVQYDRPGMGTRVVALAQAEGTPWIALIEVPRGAVMQPVDAFLRRIGIIAVALLVLGLVSTAVISRNLTAPLARLVSVADAVNQGDLGARLQVQRDDEVGRVAAAFNRLAEGVELRHRENEERFRMLVEGVRDYAIFALDAGGHVQTWNAGAERLKGYRAEEIIGRHFSAFYPPEDIAAGKPARELETAAAEGRVEDEGWRVRKDGSKFWANVLITALRGRDGELVGYAKITRDTSERRRAEDELRQSNQALRDRTAELDQTLARLRDAQHELVRREKLAILGQLASGVGHELRNPLGVMTNALYYLDAVMQDPPPNVREYLTILRNQVDLSEKIISDLLDFARVKPPQRQAVPLQQLVERQVQRVPLGKAIQVRTDIPASLPPALADQVQVGQVVLNLLTNAAQAIGDRGGTIDVRAGLSNGNIRLQVADSGQGIAPENLERIFEPLFTTKARGMGLGLAVSRALAIANGGDITVESREGEGSTFTLILPIANIGRAA